MMSVVKEWAPLKWTTLILMSHWILAVIEPCSQIGIAEDFISLVDARHLLLGFFFAETRCPHDFIRMMDLGEMTICSLDRSFVRVSCDPEDLVVVFVPGLFEQRLGFVQEWRDRAGGWMVLLSELKGRDCGFVLFGFHGHLSTGQ